MLLEKFKNKSLSVLIIDPLGSRRAQISDVFKTLGIKRITGASKPSDVLGLLSGQDEPFDWIITQLGKDETVNAFHLLKLFLSEEKFNGIRVSFALKPDEMFCLEDAFAMGLLSWHRQDITVGELKEDIIALMKLAEKHEWVDTFISAHYLRQHLQVKAKVKDILTLEKSLAAQFPSNPSLLFEVAKAKHEAGLASEAVMSLNWIKSRYAELATAAQNLLSEISKQMKAEDESIAFAGKHRLNNAVVIDPDESMRNDLNEALLDLGFTDIVSFPDGQIAWEWLQKNPEPSVIVQEWRLPKMPGTVLLQRTRSSGKLRVPIIVYSSLVKMSDRMLLREMGVTDVIEKPLGAKDLMLTIRAVLERELVPRGYQDLENRIRRLMLAGDFKAAETLQEELKKQSDVPSVVLETLAAERAFYEGKLIVARDLAVHALEADSDSMPLISLLGRIFTRLGDHNAAVKFLERANSLSPQNLQRICMLAEVNSVRGDFSAAKKALASAKKIDAEAPAVLETEVKVALTEGDAQTVEAVMQRLESSHGVIAYLNNNGVTMVARGEIDQAIDLYKRALSSLPKDEKEISATLHYNLALAMVRTTDIQSAEEHVIQAIAVGDTPVLVKANALKLRLSNAKKRGEVYQLKTFDYKKMSRKAKKPSTSGPVEQASISIPEHVLPGQIGLCGLYRNSAVVSELVAPLLLDKVPRKKEKT